MRILFVSYEFFSGIAIYTAGPRYISCHMSESVTPTPNEPAAPKPPESGGTYLALSILTTLFCCLPFGIPAIVFAAQIDGKLKSGDIEGATKSARMAKIWIITSAASGFAFILIYLLIFATAGLTIFSEALKNK